MKSRRAITELIISKALLSTAHPSLDMATFGEGPVLGLDLTAAPHQEQPFKPLKSASDLPEGLPRVLHSPVVWTGTQYRHTKEYVIFVGQKHKQELEKALREFKGQ